MKKMLYCCCTLALCAACSETYRIEGTSDLELLDGKKVYLKVYEKGNMVNIDSCRITHGNFTMHGSRDSVEMANLFVEDQSLTPIVLEGTGVYFRISNATQEIGGSPLNDSLGAFIKEKTMLDNEIAMLPRMESQMIMNGMDYDEVQIALRQETERLAAINDGLVTGFIKKNSSNVLGPGVFMIMTSSLPYPVLTPQIEEILTVAPAKFKASPYVHDYVEMAEENMMRLRDGEQPVR